MATLDSVADSFLMHSSASAHMAEENSTSMEPVSISTRPGRRMISVPAKPMIIATQRRIRTTSPRISAAPSVANSGAEKPSAVTCTSGVIDRAKKKLSIASVFSAPRSA